MRLLCWFPCAVLLAVPAGCDPSAPPSQAPKKENAPAAGGAGFEVVGRTQCVPGKRAAIAPVPLHPVVEVFVKPGDRVKKEQKLVLIDDDEPKADLRNKEALLEGARIVLKEARRHLAAAEKSHQNGALSDVAYHAARCAAAKAEQDERAAVAAVESMKAELEHYTVVAAIDGVVAWLDVHPGMVSRPGTTLWGEIMDLSELDVRCELTPEQADRVAVGQSAEVLLNGQGTSAVGRVAFVGIAADAASGKIPVCVRLPNPDGRLRAGVPLRVRLSDAPGTPAGRAP
jgi:RND family efflux transporter MFP subunit